jgi:cytochrome c-type biogenesis protein CcmH
MMRRREFLTSAALGGVALFGARVMSAQQTAPAQGTTSNLFDMDQAAAKTVRRPPKPGATPSMTPDQRDALEHEIRCQCGCTLDVYICRTTDFSCQVSPAMHHDIMSLVEGGYSAKEILDAFVSTYGEQALMAPVRSGFNWAGYLVPFAALGAGAIALVTVLRGMQRRPSPAPSRGRLATAPDGVTATADELAKLQAAVRRDE